MRKSRLLNFVNGALLLVGVISAAAQAAESGADWPQWRGGTSRDGVLRQSPKLLDHWPTNGPTRLWQSAPFDGLGDGGQVWHSTAPVGGCGSVTVVDGRVFVFVHGKFQQGKIVFTTADLKRMGWSEGLNDALADKVDKAYQFKLVDKPAELAAHIEEFLATLDAADARKQKDAIKTNLAEPWPQRVSFRLLVKLERMRDKECASFQEWNQQSGGLLGGDSEHANEIRSLLNAKGFSWSDTVVCLDARTGKTLWSRSFPGDSGPNNTFGYLGSSTPAVAGDRCYVAGSAGVYCLSVTDGTPVWQARTKFSNSSPLVVNDSVYLFVPDGLTAYDATSGRVRWCQTNVVNELTSGSVSLWRHAGQDYLLGFGHFGRGADLCCVAADTGTVVWQIHRGDEGPGYTTPAIAGDLAVTFGKGSFSAYQLAPDKGMLAWRSKDPRAPGDERGSSAIVFDGHVYVVGGGYVNAGAHCLDLGTGALKWTQKYEHNTETSAPILADGKIIANANVEKNVWATVMLKATPDGYQELGRLVLTNDVLNVCASPVVAAGRLYLRLQRSIACYDLTQ